MIIKIKFYKFKSEKEIKANSTNIYNNISIMIK